LDTKDQNLGEPRKKVYHKPGVQIYGNLAQMTASSTKTTATRDPTANPPTSANARRT